MKLRLNVGTVPVRFRSPVAGEQGVYGEMRQRDPEFRAQPDAIALATAAGLRWEDLHATLKPQVVSTGLPFCILPLASLDALQRLRVDAERVAAVLDGTGAKFVYATAQASATAWTARMPFNGSYDPATGSAAGCCISYLVKHGAVPSGVQVTIAQGAEVHRPSRIDVRASLQDEVVTDVFVGGRTIPVASGTFTHP